MKSPEYLNMVKYTIVFLLFCFSISAEKKKFPEIEFIKIPSGEFSFDNSDYNTINSNGSKQEPNSVTVRISDFMISRHPVKRDFWEKILGEEKFPPWAEYTEKCPECPAENLLFKDVILLLDELSKKDFGKKGQYRLPTESELFYIVSQCEKKSCKNFKSFGSHMEMFFEGDYKNKFGIELFFNTSFQDDYTGDLSKPKHKRIFFFTEDYPSNNYLGSLMSGKSVIRDPRPAPDKRFDYGRMMLSLYNVSNKIQVNRLGHSINMLPENSKVFFYIVKN